MGSAELVEGLTVQVLGESCQGRSGDVIHPGPVKHLHDLRTGVGHWGPPHLQILAPAMLRPERLSCETRCPGNPFPGTSRDSDLSQISRGLTGPDRTKADDLDIRWTQSQAATQLILRAVEAASHAGSDTAS